jgi:ribosome-binding protein aMBF1 (putative translation factor)
MKNEKVLNKLSGIASEEPSKWLEKAGQREANRDWIIKSAKIAIRILREIRAQKETNNMSQKVLAEKLGVSPQYINKIVKGQENLSLETICKIEKALGISLIEVTTFETSKLIPLSATITEQPYV